MIKFANRYMINKIAPDCLSIQYRGYSVDPLVAGDISEDGLYYYAAERQCSDDKYAIKGIFRKRLIKHSYLRDLYFGMVTSCVKSVLRTLMPADSVNGSVDDINAYALIVYNTEPKSKIINCLITKKLPGVSTADLYYETIDDLNISPEEAEMLELGLFNDNELKKHLESYGFKIGMYMNAWKFKASLEYPVNNGRIYNIYTTKKMYDIPMIGKSDLLFCMIE